MSTSHATAVSKLDLKSDSTDGNEIDVVDYFEIYRCLEFVLENGYKKVSLQFPDDLLCYAYSVSAILESLLHQKVYVLGDTSYGSCCVDEVAAQHIGADCLIHFGHACLSRTQLLPVLYVFGKKRCDVSNLCQNFLDVFPDPYEHVLVFWSSTYYHCREQVVTLLQHYVNLVISTLVQTTHGDEGNELQIRSRELRANQSSLHTKCGLENSCSDVEHSKSCMDGSVSNCNCRSSEDEASNQCSRCHPNLNCTKIFSKPVESSSVDVGIGGVYSSNYPSNEDDACIFRLGHMFRLRAPFSKYKIFYVGQAGLTLLNLMMSFNKNEFFTYDPVTCVARQETLNISRCLMKRYYMIERAKDANIVGIVVGTLGVAFYREIIERLKKVLKHCGKKFYTFVVGKLNVAKLANFMEVDIFVLVACSENSLLDSKEFYKPIITPYEMEIACLNAQKWSGDYVTDFSDLLPGASHYIEIPAKAEEQNADVSLITGNLRAAFSVSPPDEAETDSQQVVLRKNVTSLSTVQARSAAEFLSHRSWTGLELDAERSAVETAKEGRSGIAAGYANEFM